MKYFLVLVLVIIKLFSYAATVDTINVYSNSMHRSFNCVVIKPASYKEKRSRFPVVYLLHGYGGDFSNWIKKVPQLKKQADDLQIMIVCPDGGYSSWYFDSPIDSMQKFETYISKELPVYIDAHYKTIRSRKARAITGLSMGGHGALFLSIRHTDVYGASGSMSGVMDINAVKTKYEITKRIGDTITYSDNWKNYSVYNIINRLPADSIAIVIDCGTEDVFIETNRKLHNKMLELKIPHDYIERPGSHSWIYWANAVQYQLIYFRNYFDRSGFIRTYGRMKSNKKTRPE